MSPHYVLSTIATFPIPQSQSCVLLTLDANARFTKTMCWNPTTPVVDYKNYWDNDGLVDEYYVVRAIAIPYLEYGVIIDIIHKEDVTNRVADDVPKLHQNVVSSFGKEREMDLPQTNFVISLNFYARWIMTMTNSFMP